MMNKEIRIEDKVVVVAITEETRFVEILVNGDMVNGGEVKDDLDLQEVLDDFTEETARGAIFDWETKQYFDVPHDYASVKTFSTLNGGFEFSAMAESEGSRFMVFKLHDPEGKLVFQTRKELADTSSVTQALENFTQEVADNVTLQILFHGQW